MPKDTIEVWLKDKTYHTFDSYHHGITEAPYRLYIYLNPQKTQVYYIMLDTVDSYCVTVYEKEPS